MVRRGNAAWATGRESRDMASIAFFGLGKMGEPMAANLLRAGHRVVIV